MYNENYLDLACRRGLLELEIIIMSFFKNQYDLLKVTDKLAFKELLKNQDIDLLNWIVHNNEPDDLQIKHIVKIIQDFYFQRKRNELFL
ncbi:FAD assembly factor SdhE [Candidatus Pantoea carbekii]|uniref:FAD assembly factor SdhE n=1 Tax=Candidatus Pantoea carbekii TaxID=1235990 RepID=U3U786_9GAMM|nr:succinate dehydrogenase assembly factor 2 [Candidatus Pantoea carbekii]AKC32391.1 cytoplasmic protein YgfY [Candidatus Pantoea carbekii]BAO00114.1 hypothetical protein HHS_01440 [Candidatus Pantoea carbekii]